MPQSITEAKCCDTFEPEDGVVDYIMLTKPFCISIIYIIYINTWKKPGILGAGPPDLILAIYYDFAADKLYITILFPKSCSGQDIMNGARSGQIFFPMYPPPNMKKYSIYESMYIVHLETLGGYYRK